MLEDPRELLARALLPLEPPEPPPKALEFRDPPPPEVLRLPTRSPLPRFALLSLVPTLRLPASLPPALRSPPLCWRFSVSLRSRPPGCRVPRELRSPACCKPPPR